MARLRQGPRGHTDDEKLDTLQDSTPSSRTKRRPLGYTNGNATSSSSKARTRTRTRTRHVSPVDNHFDENAEEADPPDNDGGFDSRALADLTTAFGEVDLSEDLSYATDDDTLTSLSGFIVFDEGEEKENVVPKKPRRRLRRGRRPSRLLDSDSDSDFEVGTSTRIQEERKTTADIIDLVTPERLPRERRETTEDEDPETDSVDIQSSTGKSLQLQFDDLDSTPPKNPTKQKLASPSKKPCPIPPSPAQPNMDIFWDPVFVNEWNDKHSPNKNKTNVDSAKLKRWQQLFAEFADCETDDDAPVELSPKKNEKTEKSKKKQKSPSKAERESDREARDAAKAAKAKARDFEAHKQELAESFLKELDETVTNGRVSAMAASAGGIAIVWNKKLNTTAGRANWRREAHGSSGALDKHHCTIELATKVIDTPDRLLNVLAHEYCHLATFTISKVKDSPHGAAFKSWATKTSTLFADRGILVTTRHSYEIEYKYVWECVKCGSEYKRHSRSIDTRRHRCGACKGTLMQTKPLPRTKSATDASAGYQAFVKKYVPIVRRRRPDLKQSQVMGVVARLYHETKGRNEARSSADVGVDGVMKALDALSLKE